MKLSDTKLHMIIEAHSKEEGVEIAKKEIEYIHSILDEKPSIVKASAYNMNDKGFKFYSDKVKDKDFIIENAGQLKNEILDDIEEYIINKRGKTIFALVDLINNFDKIAMDRPSFIGRFDVYSVLSSRPQETLNASKEEIDEFKTERDKKNKNTLEKKEAVLETDDTKVAKPISHVNHNSNVAVANNNQQRQVAKDEMTIDEFVEECKSYAKSIDCSLPGETIPALYEKVEEMKDEKVVLNKENAEALIEEAANRAEKPKFFKKPKYDKEGCLILLEEHFNF